MAVLGKAGGGAANGLPSRASDIAKQANLTAEALHALCKDVNTGLFVDGYNTTVPNVHSSWHAQVFPAAMGMALEKNWPSILLFLHQKGMRGSVYGAYWALRAAYNMDSDHGVLGLKLMTATGENSWFHMIQVGATATMEAWSRREKPNLSWSHPWASAPASAVVWGLFGIEPTTPAFKTFKCKVQPGSLTSASITVPTISGTIKASFTVVAKTQSSGSGGTATVFSVTLSPPPNTFATVCLPSLHLAGTLLHLDGKKVFGYVQRDYICYDNVGSADFPRVVVRGL